MNIKKLLGNKIKTIRKCKKITQEALAESVGMDTSSISHIENGRYYPSAENLEKILSALEIEPKDIFNFGTEPTNDEMIKEMLISMESNHNLTKMIYKFYNSVKF